MLPPWKKGNANPSILKCRDIPFLTKVIIVKATVFPVVMYKCEIWTIKTTEYRRHERYGFDPWVGKIHWRKDWQPSPVFLPGKSQGQRVWPATVHRVANSQTRLKWHIMHTLEWRYKDWKYKNKLMYRRHNIKINVIYIGYPWKIHVDIWQKPYNMVK